jgi:hypothetical protein
MGAGHVMGDTNLGEEGVEFLILASPVGLHGDDFLIKLALNKGLKFLEFLEDFGFVFEKINPGKFAKIINETHIIFIATNRLWCRTPYI